MEKKNIHPEINFCIFLKKFKGVNKLKPVKIKLVKHPEI